MIEIGSYQRADWLMRRVLSVDVSEDETWIFDTEEPRDGSEPGASHCLQLDVPMARWLSSALERAIAHIAAEDARQQRLPLELAA